MFDGGCAVASLSQRFTTLHNAPQRSTTLLNAPQRSTTLLNACVVCFSFFHHHTTLHTSTAQPMKRLLTQEKKQKPVKRDSISVDKVLVTQIQHAVDALNDDKATLCYSSIVSSFTSFVTASPLRAQVPVLKRLGNSNVMCWTVTHTIRSHAQLCGNSKF
jgi:hypothetical protein